MYGARHQTNASKACGLIGTCLPKPSAHTSSKLQHICMSVGYLNRVGAFKKPTKTIPFAENEVFMKKQLPSFSPYAANISGYDDLVGSGKINDVADIHVRLMARALGLLVICVADDEGPNSLEGDLSNLTTTP